MQNSYPNPPLIYSPSRILELRDQLKRVGWTETTLDAQKPKTDSLENQIGYLSIKAALLGGDKNFQRAVDALTSALSSVEITHSHPFQLIMPILRAYDILAAMPEFHRWDPIRKTECRQKFRAFASDILAASAENSQPIHVLQDLSIKLLAGMLSGATQSVADCIHGSSTNPSLREIIFRASPGEGLLLGVSLADHVKISIDLLTTAKALQTWDRAEFDKHTPLIKKTVDVICELCYPNGNLPSILSNQTLSQNQLLDLLEHGSSVFGDPKYFRLLNMIYKTTVRRGENILLGSLIPDLSPQNLFHSIALPRTGAAVLHNAGTPIPLTLKFNTGLATPTGPAALLAVDLMTDHTGLSSSNTGIDSAGFNTVYIDRSPHNRWHEQSNTPANALLLALNAFADGETYAVAAASGQHGERSAYQSDPFSASPRKITYYERLLFLASPYIIDLFRVSGGRLHDFVYHGSEKLQDRPAGDWHPLKSSPDEYSLINQLSSPAQISNQRGIYSVRFGALSADPVSERLWFADPVGSDLITGETSNNPFLIARRTVVENEGDLFAVIHEVFPGLTPPKTRVERLTLDPRPNERNFQAVALVVNRDNVCDIFLSAIRPDILYTTEYRQGKISFQGTFGHIRWSKDGLESMQLIGGKELRYGKYGISLEKSLLIGSVQSVNPNSGTLDVQFPYPFPNGTALFGNLLMLLSESTSLRFQPLGIQEVKNSESAQTIIVQNSPNLLDPPSSLGIPIHQGDQILHETVAELKILSPNRYSFFYTAPAEVTIETDTENHRVFLQQTATLLHLLRGDEKDGAITFHVNPAESVDGRIGFERMP